MRAAAAAFHFNAIHAERVIREVYHAVLADGFEEAGPAAGAGEFGVGAEERVAAGRAVVGAFAREVPVFAREGMFRGFVARHFIHFGRQHPAPLFVGDVEGSGVGAGVVRIFLGDIF